jgi:hypothetical protein
MELHDKDEKIVHDEIKIILRRTDIEHLNKSILTKKIEALQALNKAIDIIKNRYPKLSVRELRHQEWLKKHFEDK